MSELNKPPEPFIKDSYDKDLRSYLIELNEWSLKVYSILKNKKISSLNMINLTKDGKIFFDIDGANAAVVIRSGVIAPVGGANGDIYLRIDGANTALYLNVNGVWGSL